MRINQENIHTMQSITSAATRAKESQNSIGVSKHASRPAIIRTNHNFAQALKAAEAAIKSEKAQNNFAPETPIDKPAEASEENPSEAVATREELLNALATPDEAGNIDEENLQHMIVATLLNEAVSDEAAGFYQEVFNLAREQGVPTEDAVKVALQTSVQEGVISQEVAEKINGASFRAAPTR